MGKPSYIEIFEAVVDGDMQRVYRKPTKKEQAETEARGRKAHAEMQAFHRAKEDELDVDWRKPKKKFRMHQCYEEPGSVKQAFCKTCNSAELDVGSGSYFTVLRCRKCGREACIHDG